MCSSTAESIKGVTKIFIFHFPPPDYLDVMIVSCIHWLFLFIICSFVAHFSLCPFNLMFPENLAAWHLMVDVQLTHYNIYSLQKTKFTSYCNFKLIRLSVCQMRNHRFQVQGCENAHLSLMLKAETVFKQDHQGFRLESLVRHSLQVLPKGRPRERPRTSWRDDVSPLAWYALGFPWRNCPSWLERGKSGLLCLGCGLLNPTMD